MAFLLLHNYTDFIKESVDKKKFIKRTEANEIDMIMIMYFLNIFCI